MDLKNQAIKTALTGDWDEAIQINKAILELSPLDVDSLNRLAFAYSELGNIKNAKNTYQKVLEIDSNNPIAQKNLKRLATMENSNGSPVLIKSGLLTNAFLEETGKTKVIDLINVGQPDILIRLRIGSPLKLVVKRLKIFAIDFDSNFIGMLPDNISNRLIKLMEGGNEYEACIKYIDKHKVTIFIKETVRASRFKFQPSFLVSDGQPLDYKDLPITKMIKKVT